MEFLKSGAANSSLSRDLNPEAFTEKVGVKPLSQRAKDRLKNPLRIGGDIIDNVSRISNAFEEWTKIMGISRAMRIDKKKLITIASGYKEAMAQGDKETADELLAEYNREFNSMVSEVRNYSGSPDFGKKNGQSVNLLFMFFRTKMNEAVQDQARLFGFTGAKNAVKSWAKLTTLVGIPALMLAMLNYDDDNEEDYAQVPDWEKATNFMIPLDSYFINDKGERVREYIRIPKRGFTQLYGNLIENAYKFAKDKQPEDAANMFVSYFENIMPVNVEGRNILERAESVISSLNPLIKAPYESISGRNLFFHSDTMSDRLKKIEAYSPKDAYYKYTPEFYKWLGKYTGISPVRLQSLSEGFTAQLFSQFQTKEPVEGRVPATEYPVIKRFVRSKQVKTTTAEILEEAIGEKNLIKQREKDESTEPSISYEAYLLLQLNAEEKEKVFEKLPADVAEKLRQELEDYYARD
jgi:hypothetical protein